MIPITLRSESGNRDYGRNGRVLTSRRGARGRMQVMPGTERDPGYGVTPARNGSMEELARVGRDYLAAMMRRYGNDPAKAWAAYNGGPGRLDRAIARGGANWLRYMPEETRDYVRNNVASLGRR
jgi:soluble lytic murein transglycosylase